MTMNYPRQGPLMCPFVRPIWNEDAIIYLLDDRDIVVGFGTPSGRRPDIRRETFDEDFYYELYPDVKRAMLRIPTQTDHPFRFIPTTHSERNRPLIPKQSDHRFRFIPATFGRLVGISGRFLGIPRGLTPAA